MVAVGDGALGFWAAVREVWPKTCAQRDWFHKLGNILDKLPRRLQPRVKAALHEVIRNDPTTLNLTIVRHRPEADIGKSIAAAWYWTSIAAVDGRLPAPSLAASDAPDRRRSAGATFVKP